MPQGRVTISQLGQARLLLSRRHYFSTHQPFPAVQQLPSWNRESFRSEAFDPAVPAKLPRDPHLLPPACSKWFTHNDDTSFDLTNFTAKFSTLKQSFWQPYADIQVPLELTIPPTNPSDPTSRTEFHRTESAPLGLLLSHLDTPSNSPPTTASLYLAQWPLTSLPPALKPDLPTPPLIQPAHGTIRGDIYASSLWLGSGRPPTNTPLHRDPNPNLHLQLTGTKISRLFPPDVGGEIYAGIQDAIATATANASAGDPRQDAVDVRATTGLGLRTGTEAFRGEEMMAGPERAWLDRAVWPDLHPASTEVMGSEMDARFAAWRGREGVVEARIGMGEALFIPKGWWHAVRGFSEAGGVVASVNWWFR